MGVKCAQSAGMNSALCSGGGRQRPGLSRPRLLTCTQAARAVLACRPQEVAHVKSDQRLGTCFSYLLSTVSYTQATWTWGTGQCCPLGVTLPDRSLRTLLRTVRPAILLLPTTDNGCRWHPPITPQS